MNVFIDTNILLDLYHLSGADLDELRKVIKLAEIKKLNVLLPSQVEDEFWRNRERVISEALDLFSKSKASATLPNLIRTNPKSSELRKAVERVNDLVKDLRQVSRSNISAVGDIEVLLPERLKGRNVSVAPLGEWPLCVGEYQEVKATLQIS